MADPIVTSPVDSSRPVLMSRGGAFDADRSTARQTQQLSDVATFDTLPCVIYECDLSLEIKYVSPNCRDLLELEPARLVGTKAFCQERVFRGDMEYVSGKLRCLDASGSISFSHRVTDGTGLPIWVTHSLRRVQSENGQILLGCIIPVRDDRRLKDLDRHTISRFIHKLGNHLQLLTLLSNSLRKQLPESRDVEGLHQTVEMLIELTRALSDYSQELSELSEIDFEELLRGAINSKNAAFIEKGISFHIAIDESVRGMVIRGDGFLLDTAIGSILQNALEATEGGGWVSFSAEVLNPGGKDRSVVQIHVTDSGCGMSPADLNKVTAPFFTTKKNHDGLGLSMASRFIEMHGGALTIDNRASQGVDVVIVLPAALAGEPFGK